MIFLYSDDGLKFIHNKTPHKMTYGSVSVQRWPLNTGKNNKERQTQGFRWHLEVPDAVVHLGGRAPLAPLV